MTSRTQQALALVRQGATAYEAAKKAGISASAVYRALQAEAGRERCKCCGQLLPAKAKRSNP